MAPSVSAVEATEDLQAPTPSVAPTLSQSATPVETGGLRRAGTCAQPSNRYWVRAPYLPCRCLPSINSLR